MNNHAPGNERQLATIVIADDDSDDRDLILRALRKCVRNPVYTVRDGEELMEYLRGLDTPTSIGGRSSCLVLLDLNMPRKSGHEALEEIRNDDHLRSIPVIILTTSDAEDEIVRSYDLGANAYVTKPVTFDGFVRAMQGLHDFWLEIVQLPQGARRY